MENSNYKKNVVLILFLVEVALGETKKCSFRFVGKGVLILFLVEVALGEQKIDSVDY